MRLVVKLSDQRGSNIRREVISRNEDWKVRTWANGVYQFLLQALIEDADVEMTITKTKRGNPIVS